MVIFLLMMATAFLGYTLPWGQMSYWGATVITNLFSAIPVVGDSIVTWLLGGYNVSDATVNRFYVLHWFLAFAIVGVVLLHVTALHVTGGAAGHGRQLGELGLHSRGRTVRGQDHTELSPRSAAVERQRVCIAAG